jgi:hypothetical protein
MTPWDPLNSRQYLGMLIAGNTHGGNGDLEPTVRLRWYCSLMVYENCRVSVHSYYCQPVHL